MQKVQMMETIFNTRTKRVSEKMVFSYIRRYGPVSKVDLSTMAGVTFTTISRAVDGFIGSGIVEAKDTGDSTGGRKPLLYAIKASAFFAVGVTIGRKTLEIALVDLGGNILDQAALNVEHGLAPEAAAQFIRGSIDRMEGRRELKNKILGVGLAAIGPLDRKSGIILKPYNYHGWHNVPLRELVRKETNRPVFLENKARTAVLGEHWYGAAKNIDNVVYVDTGYGIGCGHIANGILSGGPDLDITGSLGHMVINVNGNQCVCGRNGCLETYSSIYSMLKKARDAMGKGIQTILTELTGGDPSQLTFEHLCRGITDRDRFCLDVIENAAWAYGIGLANYINMARPNMFILGGETIAKCPVFFDIAVDTAITYTYPDMARNVQFVKSDLGDSVYSIGAATQVFNYCFE